jgi:hypothetical protein
MQDGLIQRKRTQIGLRMASFPVEMGLFWAFSKLGKRPPRKTWQAFAEASAYVGDYGGQDGATEEVVTLSVLGRFATCVIA